MQILPLVSEVTSSQNVNSSNNITGGGVDYDSGPYTVTIPAGQTSVSFDVAIIDDNMLETTEDFTLTIIQSSLPTGVTRDNPFRATVTLQDNDREYLKDHVITTSCGEWCVNLTYGNIPQ